MQKLQPYTDKVIVGAPGVLQGASDFSWLNDFLTACNGLGCKVGFIVIHWYGSATDTNAVQSFKTTVTQAISVAKGKPVWVDNFLATGTNAAQQQFLGQMVPWLEGNARVQRYAYVSPFKSSGTVVLNGDGSVRSLGQYYASL